MQALILAGGSGTRFWPLSRQARPKQLLALEGDRSLLQDTVDRLAPTIPAHAVWVCTTAGLVDDVRAQLPSVPAEQIVVEPVGRNTAAAIGYAVRCLPTERQSEAVAVLPADHRVSDRPSFRDALERAARIALEDDRIMTLGVTPTRPETGYGYLALGAALSGHGEANGGAYRVSRFAEKPDAQTAADYLAGGRHLWNAGIFVFRGATLLRALARHQPELAAGLETIAAQPSRTEELYPTLPATSIDFGVMEHLDDLGTVALDCGWSDLGSWDSLAEHLPVDASGNALRGDVTVVDGRDNLVFSEHGHTAVVGVEGLAVVRTGDTVLVLPKSRAQDVRAVVDALRADGRSDLL